MKLHLKIILLITCVSVGIGGFSAVVASRIMRKNMKIKLEQQTLTIAQVMSEHIVHNVIAKEIIPTRQALMNMVRYDDDIEFIYIIDFDYKVFAHSFKGDFPEALLEDTHRSVSSDKPLIRRYKTEDAFLLDLSYPLIDGLDAHIHVVMNEGYTFTYANSIRNRIVEFSLIITIIGICVGILMSRRITSPLADLADSMRTFGQEGVHNRLNLTGQGDEVDDLTISFNGMIDDRKLAEDKILSREQQLRASNQQLIANEHEREQLVKTLAFKNKELQDIVYTASHDLKSPLVNIEGFSGELKTDCDHLLELLANQDQNKDNTDRIETLLKEYIPQSLSFITRSAEKMADLLEGLLQISRVGSTKVNSEPIDMNKYIEEILTATEYQIKENDITVTVDPLPDCIADRNLLDRIFTNIISNAIKYSDPAKQSEITISGRIEDAMSIYSVADNGIGIESAHQKKIFEIFHRLNPNDEAGGEGLGLAIVTRILDRLNGNIWVESEPEVGSKFHISLPGTQLKIPPN